MVAGQVLRIMTLLALLLASVELPGLGRRSSLDWHLVLLLCVPLAVGLIIFAKRYHGGHL